jgi:hypothetical protein
MGRTGLEPTREEASDAVRRLRLNWDEYDFSYSLKRRAERSVLVVVVAIVVLSMLLALFVASGSQVEGARPNVQPFDPNAVTFSYDPNQVQGKLIGAETTTVNTTWTRDFWLYYTRDVVLQFHSSHGTHIRVGSPIIDDSVQPPDKTQTHRLTLSPSSTVPAVRYIFVNGSADGVPGPAHTFLLNIEPVPDEMILWTHAIIPWWIPKASDYIKYDPDPMDVKSRNWQDFRKLSAKYAPTRTEKQINDELFLAHQRGEIAYP